MKNPKDIEKKIKVEVVKEDLPSEIEKKETIEKSADVNETKQDDSYFKKEKTYKQKVPFWVMFLVFLLGLTLGAGLIGGFFYYQLKVEKISFAISTPTPQTIEPEPIPSQAPQVQEIEISDIKVLILNGSGIKGEAGKVENLLKEAGFEKTEIGNADTYSYQDTSVFLKEKIAESVYEKISEILASYNLKKDKLEDNSVYDVKIIVGKTKK